jgi:hypothetical protein
MDPKRFHTNQVADWKGEFNKRLDAYNSLCEVPLAIVAAGCYWGEEQYQYLWQQMLRRMGDHAGLPPSGLTAWIYFRQYPASLLMYGAAVAALAARKSSTLVSVLRTPTRDWEKQTELAADRFWLVSSFRDNLATALPRGRHQYTAPSELVYRLLREVLRPYIPIEGDYSRAFDLFEYLLAVFVSRTGICFPVGRFIWSAPEMLLPDNPATRDPLTSEVVPGLFPGGLEEYLEAKARHFELLKQDPQVQVGLFLHGIR